MDTDTLLETVREDNRTALSRLGSSKALYALTAGKMEPAAVREATATLAADGAAVLAEWDGAVFAEAATAADEHADSVGPNGTADDTHATTDTHAATDALADAEGDVERLGAFVGWTLVCEKVTGQATGFFTGQADPQTASTYRGYGETLEDLRDDALDALAEYDGRDDADAAATAVVQAAYEAYVETLESLGVNPKPVC